MSEIKHTPGPWFSGRKHDECEVRYVEKDMGGYPIDIAVLYHSEGKEQEANALLIAAAPALLEAAQWAANYIDTIVDANALKVLNSLRDAITKATGA